MDDAKQISSAVKSEKADFIDGGHDNGRTLFIFEDFECTGDEVLVESSPPPSPEMAAQLAAPAQGAGAGSGSPNPVRELIVIPELPNVHIQHTIQQVEVNGDSSGHSSPTTEAQHTYIAVAMQGAWKHQEDRIKIELPTDQESEGGNGVNYVQYVEPQEIYTQGHQTQMETLRTYPLYGVGTSSEGNDTTWSNSGEYTAYGVVVTGSVGDEAPASPAAPPSAAAAPPQRMPPATVQWLLEHYETAEGVSLPRSSLYAHYLRHCTAHRLEPVNAASFGKLIRSVFVGLRTRRLGTRGNSKYHYYGIRAKTTGDISPRHDSDNDKSESVEPESRERDTEVASTSNAACMAASIAHRSYLGAVEVPPPPSPPPPAPRRAPAALAALQRHHADNGVQFLEACAALDIAAVERSRRAFWRRAPRELPRRELRRLAADKQVAAWLLRADLHLYQKAVELLLPDVLSPIPPQLTQAIRNFAKSVESALAAGAVGSPSPARRAQAASAAALCAALRRYTSLNHLAQAARAVLANTQQIHQMLADLNRVDFRVVREQAAWACSCVDPNTAHKLEADFKATLGRGATLEQWAEWLEGCVDKALVNTKPADYTSKARRLLLDWSFYSSLVIRELTLRSAASFGSFHLIRLLYDEYVSYLVERRVAEQLRVPPIGVMQRATEMEDDTPEDPAEADDINDDQDWEWADDDDDDDDDDEVESKKECR